MTKIKTPEDPKIKPGNPEDQQQADSSGNNPENNPFGLPIRRPQPLGSQLPSAPGQDVWY